MSIPIKCSDCQQKILPKYPSWLRLFHMLEFLHYQELISASLYESCMNDVMQMKYLVFQHDEKLEKESNE